MNILPKKRWHVRNRENIARVRKDELLAANEEKEKKRRKRIAEQEAKLQIMRAKSSQKSNLITTSGADESKCHINLFDGIEVTSKNEDHESEMKEEKEKYEKQIGYLTYLGQNTNEKDGRVSWYNKPRNELPHLVEDGTIEDEKSKSMMDPLMKMESILRKRRVVADRKKFDSVSKEHRKCDVSSCSKLTKKSEKDRKLALLREKRLKREMNEKERIKKVLLQIKGTDSASANNDEERSMQKYSQRYNSQFNPHLARQNY